MHGGSLEQTDLGISSLIDTWLLLRDIELNGERNRGLYILKSRGMPHSNQIREFTFSRSGLQLSDVYLGPEGVLTGSSRVAQEARERAAALSHAEEVEQKRRSLERRRAALEGQIAALRAEYEAEEEELRLSIAQAEGAEQRLTEDRAVMGNSRSADRQTPPNGTPIQRTRT